MNVLWLIVIFIYIVCCYTVGCATVLWFRATVEARAAQHQGWQRTEAYEESRNLLEMIERKNMYTYLQIYTNT